MKQIEILEVVFFLYRALSSFVKFCCRMRGKCENKGCCEMRSKYCHVGLIVEQFAFFF